MTKSMALDVLRNLATSLRFQSTNPYNGSTKQKHVRDLLADYAARVEAVIEALTAKKASKRGH